MISDNKSVTWLWLEAQWFSTEDSMGLSCYGQAPADPKKNPKSHDKGNIITPPGHKSTSL